MTPHVVFAERLLATNVTLMIPDSEVGSPLVSRQVAFVLGSIPASLLVTGKRSLTCRTVDQVEMCIQAALVSGPVITSDMMTPELLDVNVLDVCINVSFAVGPVVTVWAGERSLIPMGQAVGHPVIAAV